MKKRYKLDPLNYIILIIQNKTNVNPIKKALSSIPIGLQTERLFDHISGANFLITFQHALKLLGISTGLAATDKQTVYLYDRHHFGSCSGEEHLFGIMQQF